MKPQDLKNLQYVLKHYLELNKSKRDPIYRIALQLADKVERELLKL